MAASQNCSVCGAGLPSNAPGRLCPRCLLLDVFPDLALALPGDAPLPPPLDPPGVAMPAGESGPRIGSYRIVRKIGGGGMGEVFLAEQGKPLRRTVALKVIKRGLDTRAVIAQFAREQQALALMDSPNIAKVLDAGETADGRPYFVMEYVEGAVITDYCDQHQLPVAERLGLFTQVCHAIQHAHQKGIIHCDLKPSNILVTEVNEQPVPKVIDFGIAKATINQRFADQTQVTSLDLFAVTPAYMSPEQADGRDIDTRSDIYSLGILLYELLAGQPAFDQKELQKAVADEVRRIVREEDPPRPSARLTTLTSEKLAIAAQNRRTEPAKLSSLVRGDLDWIVMRALEKDRNRRYETANGLAMDIARHLANEPVLARPPSPVYRFQKVVRRNRLAFAAATAVVVTLILGITVSTREALRAIQAERKQAQLRATAETAEKTATAEAAKSRQVAKFLKRMLNGVGPATARGRNTQMLHEILDATAASVAEDLKDQPEVAAELLNILGTVYFDLGDYPRSEAMQRAALEQARKAFGTNHLNIAASLNNLAQVLQKEGRLPDAEAAIRDALAMRRALRGNDSMEVSEYLSTLGSVLWRLNRLDEAETNYLESVALARKISGDTNRAVALGLGNLGNLAARRGDKVAAEGYLRQALALQRKVFGDINPDVAHTLDGLGSVLSEQGKLTEAEPFMREGLALRTKLLGDDHPDLAFSLQNLADVLVKNGKPAEAEELDEKAVAIRRKRLPKDHPYLALSLSKLSAILLGERKLEEAETACNEALTINQRNSGDESAAVGDSFNLLGSILRERGKFGESEAAYRKVVPIVQKIAGRDSPQLDAVRHNLILVLNDEEKMPEQEAVLQEVLAYRRGMVAKESPSQPGTLQNLVEVLEAVTLNQLAQTNFAKAESPARESLQLNKKLSPGGWNMFHAESVLGESLAGQKKFAEAEPLLLSGYEGMKQHAGETILDQKTALSEAIRRIAELYEATGRPDKGVEWKKRLETVK